MPDNRSIFKGTATPEEVQEFLGNRDNYISSRIFTDHGVRQEKFKKSQERMQEQLSTVGGAMETTAQAMLSPLAKKESPESIGEAVELAADLIPGEAAFKGAVKAGLGAAGIVGGAKMSAAAKTIPESAYIGPEGRIRFEISDKAASLTKALPDFIPRRVYKLDEVMKHDDAYLAYPKLREVPVIFKDDMKPGSCGGLMPSGSIHVSTDPRCGGILTLLHEVQHKVQDIEDFAQGGSPSEFIALKIDEKSATDLYRNLYGEREARAVEAKYRTLLPLYERVQKTLANRDKYKKSSPSWAIEHGKLGNQLAEVKRAENFSIQDYITRSAGDIPLITKTEPITSEEMDKYLDKLVEWKTGTIDPISLHKAASKRKIEEDMARSTNTKGQSSIGTAAKELKEAAKALKESNQKKPARLTVNRDAKGLISTIDIV